MVGNAEFAHGCCKFALSVCTEPVLLVRRKMCETGNEDFAFFTERACHEGDLRTFGNVLRHRRAGTDCFVIRMGMHQKQSAGHRGEPTTSRMRKPR